MMRTFYLSLLVFACSQLLHSQHRCAMRWHNMPGFLAQRTKEIEVNILKAALDGRIKAYCSDTLQSFFPAKTLSTWCNIRRYYAKDSFTTSSISVDSIAGRLSLISQFKMDGNEKQTRTLESVMIQSKYPYVRLLGYFKWADLKKLLNPDDIAFLQGLYYFKLNDVNQVDTACRSEYANFPYRCAFDKNMAVQRKEAAWNQMFYAHRTYFKLLPVDYEQLGNMVPYYFWEGLVQVIPQDKNIFLCHGERISKTRIELDNTDTFNDQVSNQVSRDSTWLDSTSGIYYSRNINKYKQSELVYRDTTFTCFHYFRQMPIHTVLSGTSGIDTLVLDCQQKFLRPYEFSLEWKTVKKLHPEPWLVLFMEQYFVWDSKPRIKPG